MAHGSHGDSDADFEVARRAVDRGWVTREQVELALIEAEITPGSRLLTFLPLTPDQLRRLDVAPATVPEELSDAAADPSRRVAQYVLAEHPKSGGMGRVYKAWDMKLSRWVALKFLKKPGKKTRHAGFEEEARLAAGLSHPNIAAIYEFGDRGGEPFIAMQFIEGRTLSEARRGIKPREAARIARDAAQAVDFAHGRGVIHRDLKPSNVMLDGAGRVFVMDFGLATHTEVTGLRTVSGTPGYLAPEQARGGVVDERTDVYGLGATLYELLTGRPPHPAKTMLESVRAAGKSEVTSLRSLNPKIEADLETITMKSLDRDPDRRYSSAKRLADDLERFLNRDAILARPPSFLYRLRMRAAKSKMAVAAAITAVVLAGGLGWWFLIGSPASEFNRRYADAMNLWANAARSAGVGGDPDGIPRRAREAREAFERAIEAKEEAKAQWMRGKCLELEGQEAEAIKALDRAHELDPMHDEFRVGLAKAILLKYQNSRGWPAFSITRDSTRPGFEIHLGKLPAETPDQRQWREAGEKLLAAGEAAPGHHNLLRGLRLMGKRDYAGAAKELAAYSKAERWNIPAQCLEGVCHFFASNYRGAIAALDQALSRVPHATGYNRRGLAHAGLGLWDEAVSDYNKAIELNPRFAAGYQGRGFVKLAKGFVDDAIDDFTKAIEIEPTNAVAYTQRAHAKCAKGLYDGSIEDDVKAILLDPRNAMAFHNRGLAKYFKGLHEEAIKDYSEAIKLQPEWGWFYCNRGQAKAAQGLHDAAMEDCDKAIALDPRDKMAYLNRGNANHAKGLYEKAIEDCSKAIELDPQYGHAYRNRGRAKTSKGFLDEAILDFTKAIDLDSKDTLAYATRGKAKSLKGLHDEAIEDLTRAIELEPGAAWIYNNRGMVRTKKGLLDDAITDHTKAIELDPKLAPSYHQRGILKRLKGLHDEAIADFTKAIEGDSKLSAPYIDRGSAKMGMGLYDEAIADYSKAIELDPTLANAHTGCGNAKYAKGHFDEAIASFTKAILLEPNHADAHTGRGIAKHAKGLFDQAIADHSKAIELNPKHAIATFNRGNAKYSKGLFDEAIKDHSKAIELNPIFVSAYDNRGCALFSTHRFDEAISDFSKAIELDPQYANSYGNRGEAKAAKGLIDGAIEDWKKAIERAPPRWSYRTTVEEHLKTRGVEILFKEANRLIGLKKCPEAIERFKGVVEFHPKTEQAVASAFNIARAYALLGERRVALDWLEKAVDIGWIDVARLEKDADLQSLRGEERYKKLVEKLKSK